jgi:uncharacterized protein involved in oxidation of intracellular sulfur
MVVTIVTNDPPYGTERTWNALRYAGALWARDVKVNVFLMADAVVAAKKGQKVPQGYYNLEQMVAGLIKNGATIKLCGTCCSSRGLKQDDLVEGAQIGKMLDLADWTVESDKVVTF